MTEKNYSPCDEALSHLQEYIDCEMSQVDTVRLAAHITTCPTCQVEVGVEQKLRDLVRRSCTELRAPEHLRERVMQRITIVSQSITIEREA